MPNEKELTHSLWNLILSSKNTFEIFDLLLIKQFIFVNLVHVRRSNAVHNYHLELFGLVKENLREIELFP